MRFPDGQCHQIPSVFRAGREPQVKPRKPTGDPGDTISGKGGLVQTPQTSPATKTLQAPKARSLAPDLDLDTPGIGSRAPSSAPATRTPTAR